MLKDSVTWRAFLDFGAAFHAYSLNNLLLMLGQRPDATQVAGFQKWQELGRQACVPLGRHVEKASPVDGPNRSGDSGSR